MDAALFLKLAAPFPYDTLGFKPQAVSKDGQKALPVAYIDARDVMDRMDAVFGPENWCDEYEVRADNMVVCRLSAKVNDAWITKIDIGGPSEQPDPVDRMKAAYSDSFKRAGVKWGIGRYLYQMELAWTDYDKDKRRFTGKIVVPERFLPRGEPIGTERGNQLRNLCIEAGKDPAECLKHFKAQSFGDMKEDDYASLKAGFTKLIGGRAS